MKEGGRGPEAESGKLGGLCGWQGGAALNPNSQPHPYPLYQFSMRSPCR